MNIRPFVGKDLTTVLDVLNMSTPSDRLNADSFRFRVLLQENFDPELCIVAEANNGVAGFSYAVVRDDTGYVNLIAVRPDFQGMGIGSSMLFEIEEKLKLKSAKKVVFSGGPRYIVPGVDIRAYPNAINFFTKNRYIEYGRDSVSMSTSIMNYKTPQLVSELEEQLSKEGYSFQQLDDEHVLGLLIFLKTNFPWWYEDARKTLEKYPRYIHWFSLSLYNGEIVGYCQVATDGLIEHFGPFGIAEKHRNKGVGTVLFHRCLRLIQSVGGRNAWFAWGGGRNYNFYTRNGMSETRRFAIFTKQL